MGARLELVALVQCAYSARTAEGPPQTRSFRANEEPAATDDTSIDSATRVVLSPQGRRAVSAHQRDDPNVDYRLPLRARNRMAPKIAIAIPAATNRAASASGVTPLPADEGVTTGCLGRLAVDTGETAATGGGVRLAVGLAVDPAGGLGVGVGPGVGAGVGRGVAGWVGRGVGRGVVRGVGFGVGFGVAAAATTVIVPFICESAWISQKYGYVPAFVNVYE